MSSLEAPHEYVLHGPLLATYWARLCPHSGRWASRSHACPEDAVYSLNGSGSSFTQRLLLSGWLLTTYKWTFTLFCTIHACIHLWYITQHTFYLHYTHAQHLHFLLYIVSNLLGRVAALDFWCPILDLFSSTAGHLEMPYPLVLLAAFKIVRSPALLTLKNLTWPLVRLAIL